MTNVLLLPLNGALFCSIDLRFRYLLDFAEEESPDVIEEKVLCIGTGKIETIVVDDLSLLLQPATPTGLAYLSCNSSTQLVGEWRESKCRPLLATVLTFDCVSHTNSP